MPERRSNTQPHSAEQDVTVLIAALRNLHEREPYSVSDLRLRAAHALEASLAREATLREKAKAARAIAATPDYDEEAIRDALWAVVDTALAASRPAATEEEARPTSR